MNYLGDFALESTFDFKFTTTAAATGAPTTLAGTPVISAYVDNSTTQLTAGITLTVDFDGVTGLHNVRVEATAANGYAAASNYQLVITTGTVGGTSAVGYVIGQFSIEARSGLRPTVAGRTLDVASTGEAGLDIANMNIPVGAIPLFGVLDNGVAQAAAGTAVTIRAAASFAASDLVGTTYISGRNARIVSANDASDGLTVASAFITDPGAAQYYIFGSPPGSNFETSLADNAITAAKIATGAITAAKFAAGAIDAAAIADNAIDAGAIAANAITDTKIATGAITAAKFAAGAIDAAAIATDAITNAKIAANAIGAAEIADGAIDAATFAANAITSTVLAADAITAAKVATDVGAEIAAAVLAAAAADPIDCNVEQINAVAVLGAGTSGNKWRG